jgi:hypothetical protein
MSEGNELVEGLRIFEEEEGGTGRRRTHITHAYAHAHSHSIDTCGALTSPAAAAATGRSKHAPQTSGVPCCALCVSC